MKPRILIFVGILLAAGGTYLWDEPKAQAPVVVTTSPAPKVDWLAFVRTILANVPKEPKVETVDPAKLVLSVDGLDVAPSGKPVRMTAGGNADRFFWSSKHQFEGPFEGGKVIIFGTAKPGEYEFTLSGADADEIFAVRHVVIIGDPPPPVVVDPPVVVPPVVVPTGPVNVLIVEETADRGKPEVRPFLPVLLSSNVAAYVLAHKAKVDFRQVDDDEALKQLAAMPKWSTAAAAPRSSLPWLTVTDSAGKVVHSAELPKSEADFLALLTKWGGP